MVKIKKKLAEKVNVRKSEKNKTINPFEVHINKQKYKILGQQVKNDRGLPGVSRAKALNKRKHTLLPEYNVKNKSNKFLDRRIGEKNHSMTQEDRAMARFTAEKLRHHNKKSIFNLADDEILTHRGQTLNELEQFDDPRSDDDDDNEYEDEDRRKKSGKLDGSFVGDAHFGGGLFNKSDKDNSKSYKDLIEKLIVESKKRKAEKQKMKEQTSDLTEKLDSEWKDLLPLVSKSKQTDNDKLDKVPLKADDYDKVMRELKFEARGNPSDRLKSEDEIAKEEKAKLEKLELDRLNRMQGFTEVASKTKQHRSADDLDDNFNYDSEPEEVTVAYDEGGKLKNNLKNSESEVNKNNDDKNIVSDEEQESSDSATDDDDDDDDDDLSDLKQDESDSDISESKEEMIKSAKKATHSKEITNIVINNELKRKSEEPIIETTPLKNRKIEKICITNEERNSEEPIIETTPFKNRKIEKTFIANEERKLEIPIIETTSLQNREIKKTSITNEEIKLCDPVSINEIMEKAKKELPYTYKLADSYETLQLLLTDQAPEYQNVIIERMITCNHPSLGSENKENLGKLFVYLLQHLNDVSPDRSEADIDSVKHCFKILNSLTPHLYNLTQLNPQNALVSLIEVIKEKQNDYKKKPKVFPGIDVLVFLKLISCLFSTSDFRHQVVIPSLVFINQMLTNCKIKSRYDISYGLFLVTLFAEYTTLSKRFMPSAIIYLMGIIHMAVPKLGVRLVKILPPFKSNCAVLVLTTQHGKSTDDLKMYAADFVHGKEIEEEFKIRAFHVTLKLAEDLHRNWGHLSSHVIIFEPFFKLLAMIPHDNYPKIIQEKIVHLQTTFETTKANQTIEYIVYEKKKPKALRLYEPNIQKVYDGKKYKTMSKEKAERDKLLHKYKKEMKGAIREIRRDKSFLGRVKINQQIQSDLERKEKVKQIYAEASIQQSELNALDRNKKRK